MKTALFLIVLAAAPCSAESLFAREARVTVSGDSLMVGAAVQTAAGRLDCPASKVQNTIRRCTVPASAVSFASSLGRRVDSVTLNIHFQGQIVNMAVEFAAGEGVDSVLRQLKTAFAKEPTVQYWADPEHLYASYIWVDGEAEVEITKIVKGAAGDGKVRMYASSILGGLPMNPEDAAPK